MAIITLAETKAFLNISSTETTFDNSINNLIPRAADRVRDICNRPFTVQPLIDNVFRLFSPRNATHHLRSFGRNEQLYILPLVSATFSASALVTVRGNDFGSAQFAANQDLFIKGSYLNDGYFQIDSISTSTLTIASAFSSVFVNEATGATIYFAVVDWPPGIKPLVASMIQFDYQERGTWKESEGGSFGVYGYPRGMLREFLMFSKPAFGLYK